MSVKTEKIKIVYQGKEVNASKLTVASRIPMNIEAAWEKVQTLDLLRFIAKGMITFAPAHNKFLEKYTESSKIETKMKFYGFIPMIGVHTLFFEKIDHEKKILQTKESDVLAKVWNHKISMKKVDESTIDYEDEIVIYGGVWTSLIVFWAKLFYKHRQKRWQIVAEAK